MADAVKLLKQLRTSATARQTSRSLTLNGGDCASRSGPCEPQGCPSIAVPSGLAAIDGIDSVLYARSAVSTSDSDALVAWAAQMSEAGGWVELRRRRLQCYGSTVDSGGANAKELAPLPPWLDRLARDLVTIGAFPRDRTPNHVLVNHYSRGDGERCEGILPHTDGPAYYPTTATLSVGAPALMRFAERRLDGGGDVPVAQVLLEARSLVVFSGPAYTTLLHSIGEEPREAVGAWAPCANAHVVGVAPGDAVVRDADRLSLTFRHMWGGHARHPEATAGDG